MFKIPSGQNCENNNPKECVFVNSALKILCHIVKIHSYRLLFGAFAHWITFKQCRFNLLYQMDNRIVFVSF